MDNKIDKLKTDVDDIKNSLNELKNNVSLSEDEKKKQAETLKSKAETTKKEIEKEIHDLESKTDDESKKQKEEAETLLNSFNEIMSLYASILNSQESEEGVEEIQEEKKGFFKKTKEWVGEQWDDVWDKEKWKEEWGKNLLRTAGFTVTGVGAVALAVKGVKKIFGIEDYDYEKEIPRYEEMDRKQKRKARKEFRKQKRKEKREVRKEKKEENEESESKSKENKKDDEKPFWQRPIGKFLKGAGAVLGVGTGVYYVAHGLYTKNRGLKDLWDWEKGKKLEFDAALEYCKGAIANQDNKEGMSYGMDLKYHEDTSEIEAYGIRVKIDKDKRKIPGVGLGDVEFKKYEHMINTAIVIAYLKKNYSGKCANNNPFYLTGNWQGDINVNTVNGKEEGLDGTGDGWRIVGVTAGGIAGIVTGIFGGLKPGVAVTSIGCVGGYMLGSAYDHNNIMNDYMPELDNEFGKKSLGAYLNGMACRQERNQTKEDLTESPIKNEVREVVEKIQKENPDLAEGGRAQVDAIQDPGDKDKYTIKAYGREITAKISGDGGNRKMKILNISGGTPAIKTDMTKGKISEMEVPLKEGLYMSALLGELLDKYHHQGKEYPYFNITWKAIKTLPGVVVRKRLNGDSLKKARENGGLYLNDKKRTLNLISSDFWSVDTLVYPNKRLKENMPTIFKDKGKQFLEFLNDGITDEYNVSIWKKN